MEDNRILQTFRMLFRQFAAYGRLDILWFFRDTRYCLLQIAADMVTVAATVSGVFLLSERFGGFGGMSSGEVLFLLGYAVAVNGIWMMFFSGGNTGQISRVIGRGQLDHCLIQPVPLWMQFFAGGFAPISGSGMVVCGAALLSYSIHALQIPVTLPWLAALLTSLICSNAIVFSCVYIVSCTAFTAPAAAEEIAGVVTEMFNSLKNYPLGGLPSVWQALLCTVLPIGLTAWFPSMVLLQKTPALAGIRFPLLPLLAAAAFLSAAALIFRKGLRYYAKNGSPRYTGFGHR